MYRLPCTSLEHIMLLHDTHTAWQWQMQVIDPWLALQWHHNGRDSVSNHQPYDCLLNGLFKRRSTKTSKLRVTGLCAGNSPETGEFPAQMASKAENVSIWWRHHGLWHGNNLCVTGPLWGNPPGHRWIPLTKGQSHRLWCFFDVSWISCWTSSYIASDLRWSLWCVLPS